MSSQIVQTEAIILRNLRHGETSRVATLLTQQFGKIGAIGKGARDPKSPFGASLELLSHSSFVLYYRSGRDLQFLKSGEVIREFRGILREPVRFGYGSAWMEFLDRVLLEDAPYPELFALALRGLWVIEGSPASSLCEYFRGLQLRAASLLGYAPQLEACGRCGRIAQKDEPPQGGAFVAGQARSGGESWVFSLSEGAAFCPDCAGAAGTDVLSVSLRAMQRLRVMALGASQSPPPGEVLEKESDPYGVPGASPAGHARERAPEMPAPASWLRLLDRLVEGFLRFHLNSYRGLRSLESMPQEPGRPSAVRDEAGGT